MDKTFDALLEAAFTAGVQQGRAKETMPPRLLQSDTRAYRAWRRSWTGAPHEDQEEPTEDRLDTIRRVPGTYTVSHEEAARLGLKVPNG